MSGSSREIHRRVLEERGQFRQFGPPLNSGGSWAWGQSHQVIACKEREAVDAAVEAVSESAANAEPLRRLQRFATFPCLAAGAAASDCVQSDSAGVLADLGCYGARLMRFLARVLLVLAALAGLFGVMPIVTVQAAVGDACVTSALKPGKLDASAVCVDVTMLATPIPYSTGLSCGSDLFYSAAAAQCVQTNASCTVSTGVSGFYQAGVCTAPPSAPTPTAPTAPVGFTVDTNAGGLPTGEQQPMCVNASPFIGGGFGIVSGTVLCYTGAGKNTGIYAYSDTGTVAEGGFNPFNMGTWNSLTLRDLYAGDDITAQGTLSVFGGAQIYSLDGKSGLQVNNSGVLLGSTNGSGTTSTLQVQAGNISMGTTNGTATSSLAVEPTKILMSTASGTATSSLLAQADSMLLSTANGADVTSLRVTKDGATLSSIDSTYTSSLSVSSGTGISLVAVGSGPTAVSLDGTIEVGSNNGVGVLVTGDGVGNGTGTWADVLIASQNYSFGGSAGSGVIVNDSGVIVRSASTGSTYNEFGSGAANAAGSSL